jgi:hypothetical protein
MTTLKPASRRICKALPDGNKFVAQFALPGLVPDLVRRGGKVVAFDTQREAEVAALEAFAAMFDSRTIDTRKAGGYRRITGSELSALLNEIDITVTYAAEIAGVPQHRFMKWLDGEQDVPHSVHVLFRLMAISEANADIAERITKECLSET